MARQLSGSCQAVATGQAVVRTWPGSWQILVRQLSICCQAVSLILPVTCCSWPGSSGLAPNAWHLWRGSLAKAGWEEDHAGLVVLGQGDHLGGGGFSDAK